MHLLADFFELGLRGHDVVGNLRVVALGAHGVELAEELLQQEIEAATGGGVGIEVGAELLHMASGAGEFLGDVRAVGKEGDFFDQALVIQRQREAGILQTLAQHLALMFRDGGSLCTDRVQQ